MFNFLDTPWIWKFFRQSLENFFGIYSLRLNLLNKYQIFTSSPILEFGCGDANFSKFFSGIYVGIDNSTTHINEAKKNFPDKFFYTSLDCEFPKGIVFECMLFMDVMHHLPEFLLKSILLKSLSLPIKKIIVFDPVLEQKNILGRLLCSLDRGRFIRKQGQLVDLFRSCGYEVVNVENFNLGPTNCVMLVATVDQNR